MKTLLQHVFLILLGILAFSNSLILHHHDTNGKSLLNESIARLDDELIRNNVTRSARIVGVQDVLGLPLSDRNTPRLKRAKSKGDNRRLKRGIQVPLNKPSSVNNEIENDGIIKRIKRKSKKDKDEKDEKKKKDKTKMYLVIFIASIFVLLVCVIFCLCMMM